MNGGDAEQNGKGTPNHKRYSCSTKTKVALASLLALAVIATVAAVCAAVFSLRSTNNSSSSMEAAGIKSLEEKAAILDQLVSSQRSEQASVQRRSGRNRAESCYSLQTNDSYPAAHITGMMSRWADRDENSDDYARYNSHWVCEQRGGAFVDGGMYFNQTDKKLYVPKCGYYYVSSQMYFDYTPREGNLFVRHLLAVDRKCGEQSILELESISSLGEVGREAKTSTYVADVVKICAGGKISVIVPASYVDTNPCCPGGQSTITFFSAHLVQETECEWSDKRILDHPPTQEDYDNYYNPQH